MDATVSFPENWKAPRELARALPRDTHLTGRGIAISIMSTVLIAAAVPAFLWVRSEDEKQTAKNTELRNGTVTTGEISRLWHESKSDTPMVGYAFSANGVWMHGQAEVPAKLWPSIRKAGMLPVRYLPGDPTINHPAGWDASMPPPFLAFAFPALLAACGGFMLWDVKRQGTVAAEGVPGAGVVTRCSRTKGGYRLRYQFRTPEGVVTKGSDRVTRRMENGATVCVLYLPQNPRRNNVYPLGFYRLEQ